MSQAELAGNELALGENREVLAGLRKKMDALAVEAKDKIPLLALPGLALVASVTTPEEFKGIWPLIVFMEVLVAVGYSHGRPEKKPATGLADNHPR